MTLEELTVDDIAAVLPTVSTGRAMGDWTEPDDRDADAEWILDVLRRAVDNHVAGNSVTFNAEGRS